MRARLDRGFDSGIFRLDERRDAHQIVLVHVEHKSDTWFRSRRGRHIPPARILDVFLLGRKGMRR